jgi:hypothetical protein
MPYEPGGYSEKLGNRYEGRWVVAQLFRLLKEELCSVTVEAIGDDEQGVDLWVEGRDGIREAQQCKARNRGNKNWSVPDFHSRGILAYMRFQLNRDINYRYALVSGVPSPVFQDICQSARDSNENPEDFYRYQIEKIGRDRLTAFQQYCCHLGLDTNDPSDRAVAFSYLQRTHIYLKSDDRNTRNELLEMASMLIAGEPETTVAVLADFAQDNLRKTLNPQIVREFLAGKGLCPRRLAHDTRILPAIDTLQTEFQDSIKPLLIAGELIPRDETQLLLQALQEAEITILHGVAGSGKSGVLYELINLLHNLGYAYLAVRLDRREPRNNTKQFGEDLGLPESPALCLEAFVADRFGVLILDQLDALRWTSSHSANALDVCKAVVGEVRALRRSGKRMSLVLACRTFDLENDPEIRSWLQNESNCRKIEIRDLSEEKVLIVVEKFGYSFHQMASRQKKILSSPQHLAMWVEIVRSGDIPHFQTSVQLMRQFWVSRYGELQKFRISKPQADELINLVTDYMERTGRIHAPRSIVESYPLELEALNSCGVFQRNGSRITFCHQSFLDFRIATRLLGEIHLGRKTICDWLGSRSQQSLLRREQLRVALSLLLEESEWDFVSGIQRIIDSTEVRFHIKHLALELTGQIDEPSSTLCNFLVDMLGDDFWRGHLIETVFVAHPPFIRCLIQKNVITGWLNSGSSGRLNEALWLLRTVNEKIPDEVAEVLEPYANREQEWPRAMLGTLCLNPEADSDRMFELRLQLARRGVLRNFIWARLAARWPVRAVMLLEAVLTTLAEGNQSEAYSLVNPSRDSGLNNWGSTDLQALKEVSREYPHQVWDCLMPHVSRLTAGLSDRLGRESWLDAGCHRTYDGRTGFRKGIVEMAIEAGRQLAKSRPDLLLTRSRPLHANNSPIVQLILSESYSNLPSGHADEALLWMTSDSSLLSLGSGYGEPEWMPAARLIENLSCYCSDEVFKQLETHIIHYHSPDEKRLAESYLPERRNGSFWHYWGHAQFILLPMLCPERRSNKANMLLASLQRKFDLYPKREFLRGGVSRGGLVVPPLTQEKLDQISDRAWLKIISKKSFQESGWRQIGHRRVAQTSLGQFAHDLTRMARRFPERFGRLALQFPENCDPAYVAATMEGIGQAKPPAEIPQPEIHTWQAASVETINAVLARFPPGDNPEVAKSFCLMIESRANEPWPEEVIEKLTQYAVSHADPETGSLNVHCDKTVDEASVKMLFDNSFNCVRGYAAMAIAALLWSRLDLLPRLQKAIDHLVEDAHPAVRMAALGAILPLLNTNKDLAIEWFANACWPDLRVAASRNAVHFFNIAFQSHFDVMAEIVRNMVHSPYADVAQEGAAEVAARWIFHDFLADELCLCRNGDTSQRRGVARVAAYLVSEVQHSYKCRDLLLPFLADQDKDVRQEASKAFSNSQILRIPGSVDFINAYIQSQCFIDDPSPLLYALERHPGSLLPYSELIFSISNVFSGPLKTQSRDMSTSIAGDAYRLPPLLLRLYEQAQDLEDSDISNICLDAWDLLFENRVGVTRELTKAIEQ